MLTTPTATPPPAARPPRPRLSAASTRDLAKNDRAKDRQCKRQCNWGENTCKAACIGCNDTPSIPVHSGWGAAAFTKDIEIYTGDANFGPWTEVATDSHSTWHNGATNTFPDDGTTTEWTPTAPSKYLLVRTRTNHGDTAYGGRITVRFLQLKLSTPPN